MTIKICKQCCMEKEKFPFAYSKNKLKKWERSICSDCTKENKRLFSKNNKEKINKKMAEYRKNNPEKIEEHKKRYYQNNKKQVLLSVKTYAEKNSDKIKIYYTDYVKNNKAKIAKRLKQYNIKNKEKILLKQREIYKSNPAIKIRKNLSSSIRKKIIKNSLDKKSLSIIKYLPYTIQDLKSHFEKNFENWMNWDNHGSYIRASWNDDDVSTWTWQIDHIIPHSHFTYSSMEDKEFIECWSLKNLRPLSSKQNLLDGNRR